jgi:ribonuclease III
MKAVPQGPTESESPEEFSHRIGIPFSYNALLARALTHRSYLNEHPNEALEDNERLEFLGDAVLDFLVGAWLYNHFPEMREGELTRLRSALVRTEQLAEFANGMCFGNAMRLGRGEGEGGGRQRLALLCATFEAVVGAIFLDGGLDAVRRFIEPLLERSIENILLTNSDQDPKSLFQERVQALGYPPPIYQTVQSTGPEHSKVFEVQVLVGKSVFARGTGPSKQAAAKAAARSGLERLVDEPLPVCEPASGGHADGAHTDGGHAISSVDADSPGKDLIS